MNKNNLTNKTTSLKALSQTDEYIKSFLNDNSSIYNEKNQYNESTAYYHANRRLVNFLASGKGAIFLTKQYLLVNNNKSAAFIYNPLSLLSIPGLNINHTFDAREGNFIPDRIAKNENDAHYGPKISPSSKWGNVEQIKGPQGIVSPSSTNGLGSVVDHAVGLLSNIISSQAGLQNNWDPSKISLDDALKSNEYYPINKSSEPNKRTLNINRFLFNDGIAESKEIGSQPTSTLDKKSKINNAKIKAKDNEDNKSLIIEKHNSFNDILALSTPIKLSDTTKLHELDSLSNEDLIDFYFHNIKVIKESGTDNILYDEKCYFRAYLDNLTDSYNMSWDKSQDYGRVQSNVIYQGTERNGNLSFIIAVRDPKELRSTYSRLQWLINNLSYPKYADNLYISKPPYFVLTVGNIFNNVIMYANSISINYYDKSNLWELEKGYQLPLLLKVDISFGVLFNGVPNNSMQLFNIS